MSELSRKQQIGLPGFVGMATTTSSFRPFLQIELAAEGRRPGLDPGSRSFRCADDRFGQAGPIRIALLGQRKLPFSPPTFVPFREEAGPRVKPRGDG